MATDERQLFVDGERINLKMADYRYPVEDGIADIVIETVESK